MWKGEVCSSFTGVLLLSALFHTIYLGRLGIVPKTSFANHGATGPMSRFPLLILLLICLLPFTTGTANEPALKPTVVVAQGEAFAPSDAKGWAVTPQKHSLAAHTYGGMWTVNGGLLGAPADSEGSVAECAVVIPMAGAYRVVLLVVWLSRRFAVIE